MALGLFSMAAGLSVSSAGASGEHTTAVLSSPLSGSSTTFTWSYQFRSGGAHGLSNIAISFCSADVLADVVSASPSGQPFLSGDVPGGHSGFGSGIKFDTTAPSGTLTVVLSQAYAAGGTIGIQSHSGDGQTGDQVTSAAGPGTCSPTTTSTVAPATTSSTVAPATTSSTVAPATTSSTVAPATTTSTVAPATTTTSRVVATTTTSVVGATTSTTSTLGPSTTSTSVPTSVLGARFTNDDRSAGLAGTGFNGAPLVALGALVLVLGLAVLVGEMLDPAKR